jgi:hypothetical protein
MAGEESLKLAVKIINKKRRRLYATFKDPLRSLSATASDAHKISTVRAKDHTEALLQLRRRDRVRGVFTPAL